MADFEKYFNDELHALDELNKSVDEIAGIIKGKIDELSGSDSRGAGHYLVENCKNFIAVLNQKQSILKDKTSLKKIIKDYEVKADTGNTGDIGAISIELSKYIEEQKKILKKAVSPVSDSNIDAEIEKALEESDD